MLIRLEGECIKALTSIKRGIDMLDERHRLPEPSSIARDESESGAAEEAEAAARP